MVEEIITVLSRIRWLFVIAAIRPSPTKASRRREAVGRELGVRYVLEGSCARRENGCASPGS